MQIDRNALNRILGMNDEQLSALITQIAKETGIDPAAIDSERRIAIEKAREAGKPEAMLERIAEGSVKKFLKEVTLLNQPFVKDDKKSVGDLVKAAKAEVAAYTLYVVGEGIEKKSNDFAAEVAAQAAAAKQA